MVYTEIKCNWSLLLTDVRLWYSHICAEKGR